MNNVKTADYQWLIKYKAPIYLSPPTSLKYLYVFTSLLFFGRFNNLSAQMIQPYVVSACSQTSTEDFVFSPTFIQEKEIHIIQATSQKNPAIYHYWEFDEEGRLFKHFILNEKDTVLLHLWEYSEDENLLLWENLKDKSTEKDWKIVYRYNINGSIFQLKVYQNPNFQLKDTYYFTYDKNESLPTHIRTQQAQNQQNIKTCDCFYAENNSQITKEIEWLNTQNPKQSITSNFEYFANKKIKKVQKQNDTGVIEIRTFLYDDKLNLLTIQEGKTLSYKFSYAANNVLKSMVETQNGLSDTKNFSYIFYE